MGKTQDIESISNIIAQATVHKIIPEHTNKPESIEHMKKEEIEYKSQSFKILSRIKCSEKDKKEIKEKVIRKVQNIINSKYPDITIKEEELSNKINQELFEYLR